MKRVLISPFKCSGKDFATVLSEKIKELEKKESDKKSRSAGRL